MSTMTSLMLMTLTHQTNAKMQVLVTAVVKAVVKEVVKAKAMPRQQS